jgi:photosystem II stability/assembly factor-like uncharacterized protein
VGTVGGGIFYSRDGGDSWTMSTWQVPVPPWAGWVRIRSIDVCPQDDNVMIAGSDVGLYRSIDKGAHWAHVPSPADDPYIHVWEVKYHPTRPGTIFMGFAPGAIYRSRDNCVSWQRSARGRVRKSGGAFHASFTMSLLNRWRRSRSTCRCWSTSLMPRTRRLPNAWAQWNTP